MVDQVKCMHILCETKEAADAALARVHGGEFFGHVARNISRCPSGANMGDLGFFGRGMMVPEFEQAAFALEVGGISQPVQTQFGWHLIARTE
jgi:peptidyl-prolyl cis-trans isomerase C